MTDWKLFTGSRVPHSGIDRLPPPPPWRPFRADAVARERIIPADADLPPKMRQTGRTFQFTKEIIEVVNAALYLRRPILVTGKPGSGKSSLIDAVAYELRLGEALRWAVTSRSTLRDALYAYDAVGRLQEQQRSRSPTTETSPSRSTGWFQQWLLQRNPSPTSDTLSAFLRLGPLGTALLPTDRPRALLVDEIDKADLDLPNDLLNVLEEGVFEIPELSRLPDDICEVRLHGADRSHTYPVERGRIAMRQFPLVIMTSNGERDFPQAFLRRCLRLDMPDPCADAVRLTAVVNAHLGAFVDPGKRTLIDKQIADFVGRVQSEALATDQLLNAIFLVTGKAAVPSSLHETMIKHVTRSLD